MLYRICENASSNDALDCWYKIIVNTKQVALSTNELDITNTWIQQLHKMGITIYAEKEWLDKMFSSNDIIIEEPTAAYMLDIPQSACDKLKHDFGVLCYSTDKTISIPIFTGRGWHIDTSDTDKEKSWKALLSDLSIPSNAIIIVDRYLFSSSAGETIEDSFFNLKQILELLLPQSINNGIFDVSLFFDFSSINFNKDKKPDGTTIDMAYLAKRVNKIKKDINRAYPFSLSLISVSSNCLNYDKTHNRRIISNYYIVRAEHKIKAYNERRGPLCNQDLSFSYIFSDGLYDRSTIPEKSKDSTLNALKETLESAQKAKNPEVIIYRNGQKIDISDYTNILLK